MLTEEENEKLTRIGPGTPCGEFLRRYWHPIAAASELPAERPKMRLRILGEELVLLRIPPTLTRPREEGGDIAAPTPNPQPPRTASSRSTAPTGEPPSTTDSSKMGAFAAPTTAALRHRRSVPGAALRASHPAYPVQKLGGFLWTYTGRDPAPLLPHWDILVWEHGTRRLEIRPELSCNWLQAEENTADVTHTYFLHAYTMATKGRPRQGGGFGRPFYRYGFQPFEWGLLKNWTYGGEQGGAWWGNLLIFPNMLRLENAMHWRVPIDDTHTKILRVEFTPRGRVSRSGRTPEATAPGDDPPGSYEPTWLNEAGEYHLDTFSSQDGMAWETQGPIFDRTREHLGTSDTGIGIFRQMLLDQIEAVARGQDPRGLIREPEDNQCVDLASWLKEDDDRSTPEGPAGVFPAAPADLRRRTWSEVFDHRYQEVEIPPGPARRGVTEQLAHRGR